MTSIPRIALDLSYLRPQAGGAMSYAESMLRTMSPDIAARVHAVLPRSAAAEMELSGVSTTVVGDPFRGRVEAVRRLHDPSFDAIHWSGNFMLPTFRRATMLTIHDFMSDHYKQMGFPISRGRLLQSRLVARSVRKADVVIVHDDLHRRWVQERRNDDRVAVAPLGPGPWVSTPAADLPDAVAGRPFVLLLGGDLPHKRMAEFTRLLLADPSCADLAVVHTASPLAVTDPRIIEVGRVDAPTLAALMDAASVLAMPSSYEGFGIPILEAAVFGVPVVTTPHCPARVAADSLTPVLVGEEVEDLPALVAEAAALTAARRSPEERLELYDRCWRDYHAGVLHAARMAVG